MVGAWPASGWRRSRAVRLAGASIERASTVVEDKTAPRRADGNTVDMDLQMAKLNANGTSYLALARILGRRVALLRQAIDGTR